MKKHSIFVALAILLFALGSIPAGAQTTTVAGKVLDKDGKPLAGAQITYTSPDTGRTYKLKTDKNGGFIQVGVAFGNYQFAITGADGVKLYSDKRSVTGDENNDMKILIDLSKTGEAQASQGGQPAPPSGKLTKEQQEQMAKENEAMAKAAAANAKAKVSNAIIGQVNEALKAKNWEQAEVGLKQLVAAQPDNWEYYPLLGNAQENLGQFEDAAATYDKGIQVAETATNAKDPAKVKTSIGAMLVGEGNSYLKLKKPDQALPLFKKAAQMDPNPATAYFNICVVQYNGSNSDSDRAAAVESCDKAIEADPAKADAYFIKGSALIGGSKLDTQNKYVLLPGTLEALNKYLQLAPQGSHAEEVKAMIKEVGGKVETTYKQKK